MALVAARATRSAASNAAASASAAASSVLRASHELLLPQPLQRVGESSHSAASTPLHSATPSSPASKALNVGQWTPVAAQVAEAEKSAAAAEPAAAGRTAAVAAATMQQVLPSCQSSLLLGSFSYAGAELQQHGLFPRSFLRQSNGRRLQLRLTPSSAAGLRPWTSIAAAAAAAASAPTRAAAAAVVAQSAAAAATAGDGSDAAAAAGGGWGGGGGGGGGVARPPTTVAVYRKSALWGRWYAASQEDYVATVYRTVKQNKAYLLRDVYEHMLMDGLVPTRDMFHVIIGECKRKKRLQDIFFFFNEMKARGMMLDVVLYNCIITACGLSGHLEKAFQVAAEMEANGLAPQERTFIALVTACGLAGRVPEAEGVLQRMAAAGYPMTKFTYSALITAHGRRRPHTAQSHQKIFELLEQAIASESEIEKIEGAAAAEEKRRKKEEEEEMMEEAESAAVATEEDEEDGDGGREGARYGARPGGEQEERDPRQVVHRSAIRAMLEFKDLKGALKVVEMVRQCGMEPDLHSKALLVRGHLYAREWTKAMEILEDFRRSGGVPSIDLYVRMMKGGVAQNSEEGIAAATKLFDEFTQTRGFFLNTASGRSMMDLATSDYCGNVDFARRIFAHIHANSLRPRLIPVEPQAVLRFVSFLTKRGVAEDDPQLVQARDILTHSPPARTRQLWKEHLRQQAAQQDRLLQQQGEA